MADKPQLDSGHYERVGRSIENIFISSYANKKRIYLISFWRGIAFGVGSAVGGTLVIATLLYFLSQLSDIPLIGDLSEKIREALQTE